MNKFDQLVHSILNEGGFLKGIKAVASIPSAVKTAKEFMLGDDPAGMIKRGIEKLEQGKDEKEKDEPEDEPEEELNKQNVRTQRVTSTGSKIENFDKDVIKALIASQGAVKQSTMQGQQQGTSGAQSQQTSAQQSALLKREPKLGDTFSLVDKYGKQNRYKITKIDNGKISATSLLGTSAGI